MARFFIFALVLAPWLNPFSPGPTPAVLPFVFSWFCVALGLLITSVTDARRDTIFHSATLAWLIAACLSALIGVLQYVGATAWAGVWIDHTNLGEAYGNLRQRNQFATLMNIGLATLLWRPSDFSPGKPYQTAVNPLGKSAQYLLLFCAILIGFGNAASSSRTGLVQLGVLSVFTVIWHFGTRLQAGRTSPSVQSWQIALAALVGYTIASLVLPWLIGLDPLSSGAFARLRTGDALCASRTTLWANVWHLITLKPWTGWGWGELDYAHFMTLYSGPRFCDILDNAHNLPMHIAVEFGLPTALTLCCAVIWLIWWGRPQRESDAYRRVGWGVIAVIGLHSLLEYPLWYGPFQTAALLCLWQLYWRNPHNDVNSPSFILQRHRRSLAGVAGLSLIAACAFSAWQYQLASQIYLPPSERMSAYKDNTLQKIRHVALYQDQVRFADLTTTDLDPQNAQVVHDLALDMLHFSPESRVVELVIESAGLLGREDEVRYYSPRYQAAFPESYAKWLASQAEP
ncbi:MAG: O-antigen ligase C-terminal domain-containing protein [Rhodoferax sp.]|nr:O-antigen ligase C-terminal domain-containing protein [Rhodoferax sp.]